MTAPYFSLSLGGRTIYSKMPGGNIRLPLQKDERDGLAAALKEAIDIVEDKFTPRDDATESG